MTKSKNKKIKKGPDRCAIKFCRKEVSEGGFTPFCPRHHEEILGRYLRDIEDMRTYEEFVRCDKCGRLSPLRYRCYNCGYDRTAE